MFPSFSLASLEPCDRCDVPSSYLSSTRVNKNTNFLREGISLERKESGKHNKNFCFVFASTFGATDALILISFILRRRGKKRKVLLIGSTRPEKTQIKRVAIMNARRISIVFNKLNLSEEFSGSLTRSTAYSAHGSHSLSLVDYSDSSSLSLSEIYKFFYASSSQCSNLRRFLLIHFFAISSWFVCLLIQASRPFGMEYVQVKYFNLNFLHSRLRVVNLHFCSKKSFHWLCYFPSLASCSSLSLIILNRTKKK